MRLLVIALLLVGLALVLFGCWGILTAPGRRMFDEMAGLIPFYLGIAGLALIIGTGVAAGIVRWRAGRGAGASSTSERR